MKTLVVGNNKGGVGKTTFCAHLIFCAAEMGLRVLGVDVDAQRNLSGTFIDLDDNFKHPGSVRLFYPLDGERLEPVAIEDLPNVSIIPGSKDLDAVDRDDLEVLFQFRESLELYASDFDLCVIDTPPSLNNRFTGGLMASDVVICPMEPANYSLQGVNDLLDKVKKVRSRLNPKLKLGGLVLNRVNSRSGEHRSTIETLNEAFGDLVMQPHLVNRIAVSDALAQGMPVWKYNQGESAREAGREFRSVALKVLQLLATTEKAA